MKQEVVNLSDSERSLLAIRYRDANRDKAESVHGAAHVRKTFYTKYVKRGIDIALSGAALVATLPVNAVLAVLTYKDVGSPVLFQQKRVGQDGKPFTLSKFRNMTNEKDENGNLLPPEQRVTPFGRWVRSSSLDELLNFWSVFKGDMSLIGPRPLLPEYTDRYCSYHASRLSVRPGLECHQRKALAHYPSWEEQFENDAWYAQNVSLKTDIVMAVRLVQTAFDHRQTVERGDATRTWFMGYGPDGLAISYEDIPESAKAEVAEGRDLSDGADERPSANLIEMPAISKARTA